jgi:hypothetical protein
MKLIILIAGTSRSNRIVAIVVVKREETAVASANTTEGAEYDRMVQTVVDQIAAAGAQEELRNFEIPLAVHIVYEPFTAENKLLTPTCKLSNLLLSSIFLNFLKVVLS